VVFIAETCSDYPVIISLEVHTSPEQQEIMVEIMSEYWKGMLVDLPLDPSKSTEEIELPALRDLKRKILVKVKRGAKASAETEARPTTLQAPADMSAQRSPSGTSVLSSSTSSSDELPAEVQKPPAPKAKITEALARLGIYTGGYHFKSLDQPGLSQNYLVEVNMI
jgi:hypothetical protein